MSYAISELFKFESGLFRFIMDKSSIIDVILLTNIIDVVWDSYM